ncbi:ferredoxin--NADP reductase [Spirillospora sp. NPDC047279]|uniref:ferredoxin--NADP reductase n=1 Tax=Spirillospora sp. NPDC047279 TaxID=3155478 RepID=UPI0033F2F241
MTQGERALVRPDGSPPVRGLHPLRVARVVRETADASSFVFEIPAERAGDYAYQAGQFLTFRVELEGQPCFRSYSMSSSPAVDEQLQITVKRVSGGVMSNWMNDAVGPGDEIDATAPAGTFTLEDGAGDIVAFAGGSGITPVFSILKTALATTRRRVRLLYANRDRDSIIFAAELGELAGRYGERLLVTHHHDAETGVVREDEIGSFLGGPGGRLGGEPGGETEYYICGPGPFMDVVERSLLTAGTAPGRIHVERFTVPEPSAGREAAGELADAAGDQTAEPVRLTVQLGRQKATADHRRGTTILQTARSMGIRPPSSCEGGTCATCMAQVVEGSAEMRHNDALTPEEVADGWVLTCQAVPTSPSVRVVYE